MDGDEIAALFRKEGSDCPLKPVPQTLYSDIREHLAKERKKAEMMREMSEDMYLDYIRTVNRDKNRSESLLVARLEKVGKEAVASVVCSDHTPDTSGMVPEEKEIYDRIRDIISKHLGKG